MTTMHLVELIFFLLLVVLLTKPMGLYLTQVLDPNGKTGLEFALKPLEKITYRLCGIDTTTEQNWKKYTESIFIFTLFGIIFIFLIVYFQNILPLNAGGVPSLGFLDSVNAAVSFVTNTNWGNYIPEEQISIFSNMFAFIAQNFCAAGVGICVAAALTRGIAAHATTNLGNFWVDLVRICYYLFLPLCLLFAIFFVAEGVPQNFKAFENVKTLENEPQQIIQGAIASQEAIKLLGSCGGCPTNADSSHPYENPTPISNLAQMLAMLIIPAGQIYYFGKAVHNLKHAWSIFIFMITLFTLGIVGIAIFEAQGNPMLAHHGIDLSEGNMEGIEQRFCTFDSSIFANATTAAGAGAMSSCHSSFLPGPQAILLQNMQVNNLIFGSVGAGLYNIVRMIMVSSFIASLMIGKDPHYLGKRIDAFDIKMCMIPLIIFIIGISGLTASSFLTPWGKTGLGQKGPHGFTAILYTFSSTFAGNGSYYSGLYTDTVFFNWTTIAAMLAGRYVTILSAMALAGSLALKKTHAFTARFFPLTGLTFILLITSVFFIINALGYLPSILLGPVYEKLLLIQGKLQ